MSKQLSIHGKIVQALPPKSGESKQGKHWRNQTYILETFDEYQRKIAFTLWGEKAEKFPLVVGETVTAYVNIESRPYNDNWYTDVTAYNIERHAFNPNAQNATNIQQPAQMVAPPTREDLPF